MNLKRVLYGLFNSKVPITQLMASYGVHEHQVPCIVVFGRPGAGKTTVADAAVELLEDDEDIYCIGLDLDVCVPQWMKDNFAKGIYPNLKQREAFALECCYYVEKQLGDNQGKHMGKLASVISFSFVNTDLRDVFRSRFPHAQWLLIDTNETEAIRRINTREDHFYKGEKDNNGKKEEIDAQPDGPEDVDNSEWNFAPVAFDHVLLDGSQTVETNANRVVELLRESIATVRNV